MLVSVLKLLSYFSYGTVRIEVGRFDGENDSPEVLSVQRWENCFSGVVAVIFKAFGCGC
jgi:hypothetical protein